MDAFEFPPSEFEARWRAARTAMERVGIDALLLTSEANYRYFSGHYSSFWLSKARPMMMLLPREQDPMLIFTSNQTTLARRMSPVKDIRAVNGYAAETIPLLAQAIRDAGVAKAKIGCELGFKQRLGIPLNDFRLLERMAPDAEFVDAADLLWDLRIIKSPAEIVYLRESARITAEAYDAMFEQVKPGMTERQAHQSFLIEMFKRGAERPGYIPVASGQGNYNCRAGGPTDRILQAGDLLIYDAGCSYFGYWSDFSRMVAVGNCTQEQANMYREVRDATHASLDEVKAGQPLKNIFHRARSEFDKRGLPWRDAHRIGHGIGLDVTEPPSISADSTLLMETGMVLTIEPLVQLPHGLYQTEEVCAVTNAGYDLLTPPAPRELWVAS